MLVLRRHPSLTPPLCCFLDFLLLLTSPICCPPSFRTQGDIEAVAAKSPMELTHLFEQISGSDAHKRHYDELQQSQVKAEEKVSSLGSLLFHSPPPGHDFRSALDGPLKPLNVR